MARPDADKPNLPEVLPPAVPARPHGPRVPAPWNGAPPSQQGGGDALAMLKALRRRWPVALGLGLLLAGGGAAAAWFLLAGSFTSFAVIRIASTPPWIVARNVDTPEGQREFLTYQRTQAMQIKSHLVLNAALKRDEVKRLAVVARQPDPIAWLEDELKVDFQEGSEFITVTMRGPEPDE
ncbi:MAG TPA: hypothetical protein VFA26_10205, partial [Gemmataceae bacterium]|nr:hypothetical protein [Gemmataceae bacterium]